MINRQQRCAEIVQFAPGLPDDTQTRRQPCSYAALFP